MADYGTAYITVEGDWSGFNRSFARQSNSLNRELKGIGQKLGNQGADIGRVLGRQIASATSTSLKIGAAGVAASLAYSVKKAADFEQQLSSLGAVADANAKSMERFRKQAIKAGQDTKYSALQAAQAQTELAKGGLSVQQILDGGLNSALALAAAGELDLADAAATTVRAMKLFKIPGRDSIKVADALASAANRTTADVSDFALALAQGGSAAKTAGLSFNDTVAALEALAEVGIKGSDAGTSLKTALVQLASPTSTKAVELTKKLGLSFFDAHGNIKSLVDISKELRGTFGDMTNKQRIANATTLVGQDGFRALLALYDAGPKKIEGFLKAQEKQGTAAEVAKKKQDNLKGSIEQLGGSIETLGIQVGTTLIPFIRKGADELKDFTDELGKVVDNKNLSFGQKVEKAFQIAKIDARPLVLKIERSIEDADLPGKLADLIEGGTDKINGVGDGLGDGFVGHIADQISEADLPEKIGELVSAAAPHIAEAAAKAGVLAAGSFAKAFLSADTWGQLALGGWLLTKLGGLGAFRLIGKKAGKQMATAAVTEAAANGIAIGAASGVRGSGGGTRGLTQGSPLGLAGPGLTNGSPLEDRGRKFPVQPNKFSKAGIAAAGVGSAGLAAVGGPIGASLIAAVALAAAEQSHRIKQSQKDAESLARVQASLEDALPDAAKFKNASEGIAFLNHTLDSGSHDLKGMQEALDDFGLSIDSKPRQIKGAVDALGSLRDRFSVTQALLKKGILISVDQPLDAAKRVRDALDKMAGQGSGSIKSLRTNVKLNTRLIAQALGDDTAEGREALSANFSAAIANIKTSMKQGTISTKAGTAEIERLMVKSLQNFGFSKDQALNISKTGDPDANKGREGGALRKMRGGPIDIGAPTGDSVPAMLERGEYVLNREAVKHVGRGQLDRINFGHAPRFQKGGSVSGDTDFLPSMMQALTAMSAAAGQSIFVQSGRRTVAEQLAQGPSTPGHPVAGPNGPHVRGVAADITPGYNVFGRLASRFGLGFTVMPQEPWHIQLLDAVRSAVSALAPERLARLNVTGPDSPLRGLVQAALDTTRAAAQSVIDNAAASLTPELGEPSVSGGSASGNGADLMRQISKQRGWNFGDWWSLDASETSHGANLSNPTSTARLRGQFLDSNYGKYGPGSDPRQNPSMSQQIEAMAAYIAERYGNPTKAWAFHRVHNYYRQGGLVGLMAHLASGGSTDFTGAAKAGSIAKGLGANVDLGGALKHISAGKSEKIRGAASKKLVESINAIGFPAQAALLSKYEGDSNVFGDYADRASRLTDGDKIQKALEAELTRRQGLSPAPNPLFPDDAQQAIVSGLLGRVGGKTQLEWLTSQLGALFDWRNVITDTDPIVLNLKSATVLLISQAQAQLDALDGEIKKAEAEYKKVEAERDRVAKLEEKRHDQIRDELDKPRKDRDPKKIATWRGEEAAYHAQHIALNGKLGKMRGEQRGRVALQTSLSEDVIPALETKRDDLDSSHNNLLSNLTDVQGLGGPLGRLPALPPIGVLGGKLFDTQSLIADLTDHPPRIEASPGAANPSDAQRADLLQGLLNEANLRTTLSESLFKELQRPAFGGVFNKEGTVPGPTGAPRTIIAHGGEQIIDPTNGAGGDTHVSMHFANGMQWLERFVDMRVDKVSRDQARRGAQAGRLGVAGVTR